MHRPHRQHPDGQPAAHRQAVQAFRPVDPPLQQRGPKLIRNRLHRGEFVRFVRVVARHRDGDHPVIHRQQVDGRPHKLPRHHQPVDHHDGFFVDAPKFVQQQGAHPLSIRYLSLTTAYHTRPRL